MINAYIITCENQDAVELSAECMQSILDTQSEIKVQRWMATEPHNLKEHKAQSPYYKFREWNWPKQPQENHADFRSGIYKNAYMSNFGKPANIEKVLSCTISHARLWEKCLEIDEPIMILETDARFTRQFKWEDVESYTWGALGLNDPRGATRSSQIFWTNAMKMHQKTGQSVIRVPSVNKPGEPALAQGLAGNSAYIIRPDAALELLEGIKNYGLWPNDAYLCKELWPWLRIVVPFYTTVKRTKSSTKL